jgi:hypothetical protein
LSGFHTAKYDRGFTYADVEVSGLLGINVVWRNNNFQGAVRVCQFAPHSQFGHTGWATQKVNLKEEVQFIRYYAQKQVYALATVETVEFKLPDDDYHQEWAREGTSGAPLSIETTQFSNTRT